MSESKFEVKDGKVVAQYDKDQDGKPSASLELSLSEAISEAFQRGEAVKGVKSADIKFEGTDLVVSIDSDKDGEKLLVLKLGSFLKFV